MIVIKELYQSVFIISAVDYKLKAGYYAKSLLEPMDAFILQKRWFKRVVIVIKVLAKL